MAVETVESVLKMDDHVEMRRCGGGWCRRVVGGTSPTNSPEGQFWRQPIGAQLSGTHDAADQWQRPILKLAPIVPAAV